MFNYHYLDVFDSQQSHNYMEQYAEVIGEDASVEDYLRIATHFKKNNEHFKAGQFFFRAGEYEKVATRLLEEVAG